MDSSTIKLQKADITVISEEFYYHGRIHFNGLSYNKVLSTIEKNTFEATPDLEDLRLSHNPGLYWLHPEAWPLTSLNISLSWRQCCHE